MSYASDKKPGELTALTSLATDDVFVVGDTSDTSEVAKGITKANLITDLTTSFAPALTADQNYVSDAQLVVVGNTSGTNTGDNAVNSNYSGLVTNATHTGEVTGDTALTVDKTAITGKTAVTAVGTDYVLISDTSDSGNLKKALVSDFAASAVEGTAVLSTGEVGGVKYLREDGDGTCSWQTPAGSGDVVGPASATDNAVVRFDGATGKLVQNSTVTVGDTGNVGIGASETGFPLSIKGAVTTNDLVKFWDNGGTQQWHFGLIDTGQSLDLTESGVANNRMTWKAGGNVGINKSAPAAMLDINQDTDDEVLFLDKDVTNTNNTTVAAQIDHTSVVTDAGTYTKTGAALQINSNVTETSGTITDSAQVLDINQTHADATGNVVDIANGGAGVGLKVAGTAVRGNSAHLVSVTDIATAGTNAAIAVVDSNTTSQWASSYISSARTGTSKTAVGGSALGIEMTGVGVAINTKHDDTGTAPTINLDRNGNNAGAVTGLWVNTANAGAGAAYAAIFEAGRVGIGTTTPAEALSVTGNVAVSGDITQSPAASADLTNYLRTNGANASDTTTLNPGLLVYHSSNTNAYGVDLGHNGSDYRLRLFAPSGKAIGFAFTNTTPTGQSSFTEKLTLGNDGTLTTTNNIELGHASDTTLSRVSAGVVAVEGVNLVKENSNASAAEINTGTSTTKFNTPDALAGSNFGIRYATVTLNGTTALTTSEKAYFRIPAALTGMNLVSVAGTVGTGAAGSSSSGTPTFTVKNVTDANQMLSTSLTVDAGEYTSATAVTAAVINASFDDVVTDDLIEVAVTTSGTGVTYATITLGFQLP